MTHLPYVVASTSLRLRLATRRLRAIDPRAQQETP